MDRVSRSRWPFFKDQSDEDIAKKLGVRLDVLHDARAQFEERTRKEGLMPGQRLGYKTKFRPTPQDTCVSLEPPEEIYKEWVAIRERMRSSDAIMLRTVIHAVLQMTEQPSWIGKHKRYAWIWQGEWAGQEQIRAHRFRIRAKVNDTAYQALLARAVATHTTPSAIARWGVILLVHGKLERFSVVSIPRAMYKDFAGYCLKPTIVDAGKREKSNG